MMLQQEMDINDNSLGNNALGITSIRPHRSISYDDYYRHQRGHHNRSQSMALSPRKDANKRRLLRRMSQSFIPNCVLVPNRNPIDELYKMFPQLPPGEKPLNGFSCALYKDILLQGKMTICSSCICFHSNIFGYETRLIIYFKNVLAIKREKTAFVVPNAISIRTLNKRYLFCSFLSRESSFKLLSRVWKHFVNEDNGKEGRMETEPIKIKAGPREENTDDMLNLSSSTSSYGSTFPASISLPERPHSSPPSIGGIDYNEIVSPAQSPRTDIEDCVFRLAEDGFDVSTEFNIDEQLPNLSPTSPTLRRVKSTTNINEVETLGHKFCFKNLERLRDERRLKKESSKQCVSGKLCSISSKLKDYRKITTEKFSHITSLAYNFKTHHPFVLVISLLVLFLAILSFNLLLRINVITESLHSQNNKNEKFSDNVRLKDMFEFEEGLHSANVERVKGILSVNLETVNEVQKTLKELREKLNGNS